MHRRAHRTYGDSPASMSACLSPVQIGLRGFPDGYVPAPAPQGPMPGPMPIVPPYQNAPSFASDSEAASESGAFQRQQHYYSPLVSPQIPDHSGRPGDPPTPYSANTPLLPSPSEVGDSTFAMQRDIRPAMRSPRQATPTPRSRIPRQDAAASPIITPRQAGRSVSSPLAVFVDQPLGAIGPLPLTPPYQANISVSSSPSEIGNSGFAMQQNMISSSRRAASPRSPMNRRNGVAATGPSYPDNRLGPLSSSGMPSPYGGPASPRSQFDNQDYPRSRGESSRYSPANSPIFNPQPYIPMLPPSGMPFPRGPDMNTTPVYPGGAVLSATMSASVTYRSGSGVVSASAVQTGSFLYMSRLTPSGMTLPSTYPAPPAQRNSSHSRSRRSRRKRYLSECDSNERMRNSGIMLRTGGEGRRGSRARVASDVGSQPPVIPTKMCPYHPGNHWYSDHQSEPHEVMPYGYYGQSTPPYNFVTFDETYPCGNSAMKPKSKLSKFLPCFFKI